MGVAVQGVRIGRRVRASRAWRYAIAGALVAVTFVLGLMVGKAPMDPATVLGILASALPFADVAPWWPASHGTILLEIRLPRVVMGALVGAALSVAGASYQGLFRNPLADPYLIGVAAGAGLGAAIAMAAPLPPVLYSLGIVQLAAFLSAMATVGMVYSLARVGRSAPVTTLLLAGVAMGSLASAATAFVMYGYGDKIAVIYAWMLGGFNVTSWQQVMLVAPFVLATTVVLSLMGRMSNVLQLDDDQARSLGIDVERVRLVLVTCA
ncbi:MAG TPA: iron ABC transporter permease, partial [Chloroflexota bacterium]|nr:iron ABC transporter permease [Chloroflexota bacterium]